MNRDPVTRALVVRGYIKLAALLAGLAIVVAPVFLYPGLQGIRIMQISCGVIGIGLAVWQGIRGSWSWPFCIALFVWSAACIGLAYAAVDGSALGLVAKNFLIVFVIGFVMLALPRIPKDGPSLRR
jgi:hypothetical protein